MLACFVPFALFVVKCDLAFCQRHRRGDHEESMANICIIIEPFASIARMGL